MLRDFKVCSRQVLQGENIGNCRKCRKLGINMEQEVCYVFVM